MEHDPELEKLYNNRALCEDYEGTQARWQSESARVRDAADTTLDVAYGSHAREKLDVLRSGADDAPLMVFIHGGYWQRGDKSTYAFIAEPYLARGFDVALIGYPLCPEVTLDEVTASVRRGVAHLYKDAAALGVSPNHIGIIGNSAGGHLTAMMLATDWPALDPDLPADLVKGGVPISGLYKIAPLLPTSIAEALNLDEPAAERASPVNDLPKCGDAPILLVRGGNETPAFAWQILQLREAWGDHANIKPTYDAPGADHFTVLDRLADPTSELTSLVITTLGK